MDWECINLIRAKCISLIAQSRLHKNNVFVSKFVKKKLNTKLISLAKFCTNFFEIVNSCEFLQSSSRVTPEFLQRSLKVSPAKCTKDFFSGQPLHFFKKHYKVAYLLCSDMFSIANLFFKLLKL